MRKACISVIIFLCGISMCCVAFAAPLQKGDMVFTRSYLRAKDKVIFWHNLSGVPEVVPAGTEVKISRAKGERIIFVRVDTNKLYELVASAGQWEKYFVKDKQEVNIDALSPEKKEQIAQGDVVNGMTKEEVYIAKGCPAYLAYGKKSFANSFADVMLSDTWYYMKTSRVRDVLIEFKDGVVSSINNY